MPVFGSILAVGFLGEQFHLYHAVGIVLIAGGIVLASVKKGAAAKDRERLNMLWVRRGRAG
jgi:drug/metabolite transporter (DMT)-like permease